MVTDVFVHPSSIVETQQIGQGTRIWAYSHIMKDVSIGEKCNIGDHCFAESGVTIGNDVTIKNGNVLWEGITLENGVFVGPQVHFTNDLYPRSPRLSQAAERYAGHDWLSTTLVREGATLGAGAVIVAGITIGEYAMVGAGAVVTRDVPPYALVIGNPAHTAGWVCQCGQKLHFVAETATCDHCGVVYADNGGVVAPLIVPVPA
ncbi:MAG: acyltransferase [Anaerolineae bacterium]